MSCCGQKRATMNALTAPPEAQRPAPALSSQAMLRHAREGGIVLRGPYSGRFYRFSNQDATAVLAEDADALLRTGVLERVSR